MAKYGILIYALGICVAVIAAAKLPSDGIVQKISQNQFDVFLQQQEAELLQQNERELELLKDLAELNATEVTLPVLEKSQLKEKSLHQALVLEVHKDYSLIGIGAHKVIVPRAWVQRGEQADFTQFMSTQVSSNLIGILTVGDVMEAHVEFLDANEVADGREIVNAIKDANEEKADSAELSSVEKQYAAAQLWKPLDETWPDTMYLFNDGVILTILGLALWRLALRQEEEEIIESDRDPLKLLAATRPHIEDLYRSADDLESYQFLEQTKLLREQYLLPIGAARQQLINRFGMQKAAELLITLSYGERILNRVASAAIDQHLEEAAKCAEEAYAAFQEVYALMNKL